jgi:Asp/Glu/hydantoin racemase
MMDDDVSKGIVDATMASTVTMGNKFNVVTVL